MNEIIKKIGEQGNSIKNEVRQKVLGYLLAGFGFVAGLAWNDAIKTIIEQLFPLSKNTAVAKVIYALAVTVVVVVVSIYLAKIFKGGEETPDK